MAKRSRLQRVPDTLTKKLQLEKVKRGLKSTQDIWNGIDKNYDRMETFLDEIFGRTR